MKSWNELRKAATAFLKRWDTAKSREGCANIMKKRLKWACLTSVVVIVGMMGCQGTKGTSALKDGTCYASRGLYTGISDDELMLPIDKDSNYTNADVIVYMVNVESDESAPREKLAYPFQKEFLNDYVQNYYELRTDYILVVENHSQYPYVFSPQYAASGYDCLELDFLTSDKRILTASKRMPHLLSDRGEENLLRPNWQWKYLVSLDIRLWKMPKGFSVDMITHFRPRFAYGAFFVDGKYYRTITELETHKRKELPFKSREGELVGKWMPFQPNQLCWRSWK